MDNQNTHKFYIDGMWQDPFSPDADEIAVINPATERKLGTIASGSAQDVDRAVSAARSAFNDWSRSGRDERRELLHSIAIESKRRYSEIAEAISLEMGAPRSLAHGIQAEIGLHHLDATISALEQFSFEETLASFKIVREPIGVCGLITPWNWPINQIVCKVAPALAAGCTMVLKPSELSPYSAILWAEVCHEAGVPPGVFNLVQGEGSIVGAALSEHPDVDMVSFTGSTRAGIDVARRAADTVKRVHQELGGKSPHIVLDDDELSLAVVRCVRGITLNAGQNCNAPTRLLIPANRMAEAEKVALEAIEGVSVGQPKDDPDIGPVVSRAQWDHIQSLIAAGLSEGATLLAGGLGRPESCEQGYFVKPTIFTQVTNAMSIARDEVFGPVLSIIAYESLDQAVEIANDTPYGLAAYVSGKNRSVGRELAGRLRAGQVVINGAPPDYAAPFGGYKRSGNGREWGPHAITEFLETKAILEADVD